MYLVQEISPQIFWVGGNEGDSNVLKICFLYLREYLTILILSQMKKLL